MKAIIYREYGSPEVLQIAELKQPVAGNRQILIRVRAAEATKGDCELRSFCFPVKWFSFGLRLVFGIFKPRKKVLGGYFAGEVVELGEGVTKLKVGDQVFGTSKMKLGAYAQYLVLPESYTLVPKPENINFVEAAAVPLGALNALHFLRLAKIQTGENILINGAGGSIGIFAVQIARSMGASVTAVDHPRKEKLLRELGVEHFVDYTHEDFRYGEQKYAVIFDMVATSPLEETLLALTPGGRYITGNPTFRKIWRASKTFKQTGKQVIFAFAEEREEELQAIKILIEAGKVRPIIDRVFSMEQAAEAHRRVETEARNGIVVISMD